MGTQSARKVRKHRRGSKAFADSGAFFDDFSNPGLARYYEIFPGIGAIVRREGGLHYEILRAPDGPSSAMDYLTIDSLGRPQSPTRRAVLRFTGTEWTLEACVEYDFRAKRNGRTAYLWLVHGDVADRYDESIALVRSADLAPDSHSLRLDVHDRTTEAASIELARAPGDRYWLRITRTGSRDIISWSEDGRTFRGVLERSVRAESPSHSVVINSSSFAGGASFVLRSLRLSGTRPDPAPEKPTVFALAGPATPEVAAADIVAALQAGRDVDLRACAINGTLDLGQLASPLTPNLHIQDCRFRGSLVATNLVSVTGAVSFLNCQFAVVGLSNVEFIGPLSIVNCQFTADTRFIDTDFRAGANFSGSTFSEKPFFRVSRAARPMSFYHATLIKGADLSSATFDEGDRI